MNRTARVTHIQTYTHVTHILKHNKRWTFKWSHITRALKYILCMSAGLFPWKHIHALIMSHMCLNPPTDTRPSGLCIPYFLCYSKRLVCKPSWILTGSTFTKPVIMMANDRGWSQGGLSLKISSVPRSSFADGRMWNARWKFWSPNNLTNVSKQENDALKKIICFHLSRVLRPDIFQNSFLKWCFCVNLAQRAFTGHTQHINSSMLWISLCTSFIQCDIVVYIYMVINVSFTYKINFCFPLFTLPRAT